MECPWNLRQIIENRCRPSTVLVDIGCGTGARILPLRRCVKEIIGVEPNAGRRGIMNRRIEEEDASNVKAMEGNADRLPLRDLSADIVTVMVAPFNLQEIMRVLRPGGAAILEKNGERDKIELKTIFGADAHGLRGFFSDLSPGARREQFQKEFSACFANVRVEEGCWDAYIARDELTQLLDRTHIVRGFSPQGDRHVLDAYERQFATDQGIRIQRHRILVIAENKRNAA